MLGYYQNKGENHMKLTCNPKDSKILMQEISPTPPPYSSLDGFWFNQELKNLMEKRLNDREKNVLNYRMGLSDGNIRTFNEIGKVFKVSCERIRQIECKALRKLRHPCNHKMLWELFEQLKT